MTQAWDINGEQDFLAGDSIVFNWFVIAVGETADDHQQKEENLLLSHFPRHCHHLHGLVLVHVDRSDGRGDQAGQW